MSEQTSNGFGTPTATPASVSGGVQDDPVQLLVGEGKKFKTVQDLAKGKIEADNFVEQLKTENKALRDAIASGTDTTDIRAKIDELLASSKRADSATAGQPSNQSKAGTLTTEEVLTLLDQRDSQKTAKTNSDLFNATIAKSLGDKATETVMQRIQTLGLDLETFNAVVMRNPTGALALVGIKEPIQTSATVGSKDAKVNTAALFSENSGNQTQNFAYFDKLRKEIGAKYFTPEVQAQVFQARKELGDAFWKK
jgi:hypothetical protein